MFGVVRPTASRLVRDPWSDVARLHEEMDDLMARVLGATHPARLVDGQVGAAALPVELYETPDSYLLRAHLPGVAREDVNVEVEPNRISLWGERRAQTPEGAQALLNTAVYGRFRFQQEFPAELQTDGVEATYRDGILEIRLPKAQPARPQTRKVEIQG